MDNQHKLIRGYRDLTENEIDQMNEIKELGERVGRMIANLAATPDLDQRWVSIARTELQQGFMAAVRAVARPGGF